MVQIKKPVKKSTLYIILSVAAVIFVAVVAAIVFIAMHSGDGFGKNDVPKNNMANSYYYNRLPAVEQGLYDAIYTSALEYSDMTAELSHKYSAEEYDRVVLAIEADHPEMFYINFNAMVLETSFSKSRVKIGYLASKDDMDRMQQELETALDGVIASVRELAAEDGLGDDESLLSIGEFELEVMLHDRLCDLTTYYEKPDVSYEDEKTNVPSDSGDSDENGDTADIEVPLEKQLAGTAYGALVNGKAFSDGYALAMKLLANEAGLSCDIVRGTADGESHMWNIIYINGKFYHLDPAYNDADIEFAATLRFHGYFNLTADAIKKDHTIDREEELPVAQHDYDYYRTKNLYAENLIDLDRIAYREVLNAVYSGKNYVELYITFSRESDSFKQDLLSVISRVNNIQDDHELKPVFRAYNASATNNALTIQLYYTEENK